MKKEAKPKLTDAERHKRFLDMAKKVEASDDPKELEKAVMRVAGKGRASAKDNR